MEKNLKALNFIVNIILPPVIVFAIYNFIDNNNNKMSTGFEDFMAGLFLGMSIVAALVLIVKIFVNLKYKNSDSAKNINE